MAISILQAGDVQWYRDDFGIPTKMTVDRVDGVDVYGMNDRNGFVIEIMGDLYDSLRQCEESPIRTMKQRLAIAATSLAVHEGN